MKRPINIELSIAIMYALSITPGQFLQRRKTAHSSPVSASAFLISVLEFKICPKFCLCGWGIVYNIWFHRSTIYRESIALWASMVIKIAWTLQCINITCILRWNMQYKFLVDELDVCLVGISTKANLLLVQIPPLRSINWHWQVPVT